MKHQIIKMQHKLTECDIFNEPDYVDDPKQLLLMIETKTYVYTACQYLHESEDWLVFLYIVEPQKWECVSVKKEEVIAISIIDPDDVFIEEKEEKFRTPIYQ